MYVKNKVALITGGASGLGLVYAANLLKEGLKGVALVDVNTEKGEEAVANFTRDYGANKAIFIKTNVVHKDEFENAIKKTIDTFGNFDILINNAGILDENIWEEEINVNLKGVINGCLLASEKYLPKYKSNDSEPLIVNISSTAGFNPSPVFPIYSAIKRGVISLTKSLSNELNYDSQRVKIIAVCPAITSTAIIDNLGKRTFTPRHAQLFGEEGARRKAIGEIQTPEVMAEAMIKIIENSRNGDVWVVREGRIFQVEIPEEKDLKVLRRL